MNKNNYVAIMAGGIGSRFWPMSRERYPKQFLDVLHTGESLLQSTYKRFLEFIPQENIYIITSDEYVGIVEKQLPGLPAANILGEPEKRNTAPCIAYISFKLQKLNPDANLIVAPSDHLILDVPAFQKKCEEALLFTENTNALVTLGIKPSCANTGYGYIHYNEETKRKNIHQVIGFHEKPDARTANKFLERGDHLWNAGIFIWKAKDIIDSFRNHMPDMFDIFVCGLRDFNTEKEESAIRHIYKYCESISIDYAIMEKAKNAYVIPSDFAWSDLGTWNSAWENHPKDGANNAIAGSNTLLVDAAGCLVHSNDQKLVFIGGVDNLIVVNTPDALLICKKENEQQIKEYVAKIKEVKGVQYL
jgi:mannose-1-phosphate guanylyltransferase